MAELFCSTHFKKRSAANLMDDGMGGYRCQPGQDCQVGGVGGAQPQQQPQHQGGKGQGKEPMAGDWSCPGCNDHQFARNTQCRRCGTPKPADAAMNTQGVQLNAAAMALLGSQGMGGIPGMSAAQMGALAGLGGMGGMQGMQGMGGYGGYGGYQQHVPQQPQSMAPSKATTGGVTPAMNMMMMMMKQQHAGATKEALSGDPSSELLVAKLEMDMQALQSEMDTANGGAMDNDWCKPAGTYINRLASPGGKKALCHFFLNNMCNKGSDCKFAHGEHEIGELGEPTEGKGGGKAGGKGFMPGDWTCPGCNDHQFQRNTECRKCGTPNPSPGGGKGGAPSNSPLAAFGRSSPY